MPNFYNTVNNATAVITSPHTAGDGNLYVNPINIFGSGGFPLRVTCVRQSDNAVVIYRISGSGATSLTIGGVLEGTTDIDLAVNDVCQADITAGALKDIHDAINAISASGSSPTGTSGAIPIFTNTGLIEDPTKLFYDKQTGRFGVGTNSINGQCQVNILSSGTRGFIVKRVANQNENFIELQNEVGNPLSLFDQNGGLALKTSTVPLGYTFAINGPIRHTLPGCKLDYLQRNANFIGVFGNAGTNYIINYDTLNGRVAIGGVPNMLLGSKLCVDGNCSIGSTYHEVGAPTNGLIIQGSLGVGVSGVVAKMDLAIPTTSTPGISIKKIANQTSNSFEIKDENSNVVASISSANIITASGFNGPNGFSISTSGVVSAKTFVGGVNTITSHTTLGILHNVVKANASSGDIVITLPNVTTSSIGKSYTIKRTDNSVNVVYVSGVSSQTIDGQIVYPITSQYTSITIIGDQSEWSII